MISTAEIAGVVRKTITPSDVHVNRPLTNISVAMFQSDSDFISDRIFPRVPVTKQSDLYTVYPPSTWNMDDMKKRAPATETAGGGYDIDRQSYFCDVWGVHRDVDDQLRANADNPISVDTEATAWVTRKGLIRREVEFADRFFNAAAWTHGVAGVAANPGAGQFLRWSDAASEPVKNIGQWKTEALLRTGIRMNTLVLGHEAYETLKTNPTILDLIKFGATPGSPAMVTKQLIAQLFEIERVEVMSAIVNMAKEGAPTPDNRFIGDGRGALLCHAATTPGLMTPSAGYTFVWTGYNGAGEYGNRLISFRMENIRSDRIEMELAFSHQRVADDLGFFISDIV